MNNLVTIGPISTSRHQGAFRVQAEVLGETLWFESKDAKLAPAAEAFGGALLLPTLYSGRTLQITDPVCPSWEARVPQIMKLLSDWWDYSQHIPVTRSEPGTDILPASAAGLLFTGGADSFFSLLKFTPRVDTLVYVLDYDVPPHAPQRFSNFEPHLRRLAAETGTRAIIVRSNLRRLLAFRGPSWHETHGAALIAVGHLLRDEIGSLVVSSSHPRTCPEQWGTHWDLDPLWSSSRVRIVHFGEETRRSEKIRAIVEDPLVQRYLRPCWENLPNGLNCSICEKCVRTQLVVARWGDLDKFSAFDHSQSLADRLWGIKRIPRANRLLSYYDCLQAPLPVECHKALAALIRRSHRYIARKKFTRTLANFFRPQSARRNSRAA